MKLARAAVAAKFFKTARPTANIKPDHGIILQPTVLGKGGILVVWQIHYTHTI